MIQDDVISYREMCDAEEVQTLQRGMNYRLWATYSVVLMSQRGNAPYTDRVHDDGVTIEYEGHDEPRTAAKPNPKSVDQPERTPGGGLTQNGLFKKAVDDFKKGKHPAEKVKIYEKLYPGVWSLKGFFDLVDYSIVNDGHRNVFRFMMRLGESPAGTMSRIQTEEHTRIIPAEVKKAVYKRDRGMCQYPGCGSKKNLHFDHDLPFSKGGASITAANVRLLCAKHNLEKGAKIQ